MKAVRFNYKLTANENKAMKYQVASHTRMVEREHPNMRERLNANR